MIRWSTPRRPGAVLLTAAILAVSTLVLANAEQAGAGIVDEPENYLGRIDGGGFSQTNRAGDSVVVFERRGDLYVRTRPTGGAWQTPQKVAGGGDVVGLTLDGAGNPTVAWVDDHLWVRSRTQHGWGRKRLLHRGSVSTGLAMTGNEAGTVAVMYLAEGLQVDYRLPSGRWRETQVLFRRDVEPMSLRVALDRRGRATAAWVHSRAADRLLTARSGPRGRFGDPAMLSPEEPDARHADNEPDLAMNGGGDAAVAWLQETADGSVSLVRTRIRGEWGPAEAVGAGSPRVAIDPQGGTWAVWQEKLAESWTARMSRRPAGGVWTDPVALDASPERLWDLDITASPAGSALVTYRKVDPDPDYNGNRSGWFVRAARPDAAFSAPERLPHTAGEGRFWVSLSGSGDALITTTSRFGPVGSYRLAAGPDPLTHLYAVVLDVTGPRTRMTRPRMPFSRGVRLAPAWSASDTWSSVVGYRARLRSAAHDASFGPWQLLAEDTSKSAFVRGARGRTYCFRARATDAAGNTGRWSGGRCIAVPLDDRDLRRTGTWREQRLEGAYRGSVLRSTRRGASLSVSVATRRLALLAARGPGHGSVAVFLGSRKLREVSLAAADVQRPRLIPVARFSQVREGRVRLVVTSPGRPVVVDGLATSRH